MGFIVPGGFLGGMGIALPFSWYATVRHKITGHESTLWFNGSQVNRETVAAHIGRCYKAVEVITIDECKAMPTRPLKPVPADFYEFGIRLSVEEEFKSKKTRGIERPAPISRQPITRKSILRG